MDDIEKMIIELMRNENKVRIHLPKDNELLIYLHSLILITGRSDVMYCNAFLDEAIQLLINSIFLYEDGLFDCAFYSVRQAGEVVDSMLYLSKNDSNALKQWSDKKYFPMDSNIKSQLNKLSEDYQEMKSLIPELFEQHAELIKKSHKIIHKQGFDTFYRNRIQDKCGFSQDEEAKLFTDSLEYTIGIILIIFILIEPLSLALSDEDVTNKLNFDFLTEPIDIDYFSEYLQLEDVVGKIKGSNFYTKFISNFTNKESMLPAVYYVVREDAWDVDALDEIEKQLHLLDSYERFMFCILKCGIRVSNFYYNGGLSWYLTSIKCNYGRDSYGGKVFDKYLEPDNRFNQPCENVFISVIVMYEEPLFLEHNELLSEDEIKELKTLECQGIQKLKILNKEMTDL